MFYRFSENTFACKSVCATDFRAEVFDSDQLSVDAWAPFNVFGFVLHSESTKARLTVGDLHEECAVLPSGTFGLIPACTETKIVENGRVELLTVMFRPLFCCGVAYDFPQSVMIGVKNAGVAMIAKSLAEDINRHSIKNRSPIEAKVAALLAAISDLSSRKDPVRSGLDPSELAKVVEVIESSITEKLSNEMLAEVTGLSVDTFRRKFQESTGVAPHQYISRARAARARLLIEGGKMSLAEVALEAGYCSQSHMTRMFLETFGVSPGRFKRMRVLSS